MKRKHIEELILACHTDTDLAALAKATKRELRFVLMHEIAHLKMRAEGAAIQPQDEIATVELTPEEAFKFFAMLAESIPSYHRG
jgi:hypothetical protein